MTDLVFFWTIFALVITGLILSCIILCYLPLCIDRADYLEWASTTKKLGHPTVPPEPPTPITKPIQQQYPYQSNLRSNTSRPTVYGSATYRRKKPDTILTIGPKTGTHSQAHKDILSFIESNQLSLNIVYGFKLVLDMVLFLSTLIYPPLLWFVWIFFPTNSTVIFGILFLGSKALSSLLVNYIITLVMDKWKYQSNYPSHTSQGNEFALFKSELRLFTVGATLWCFGLYIYVFIRMGLMYAASGILLVDGWILLSVLAFIDILFIVFPLTLV